MDTSLNPLQVILLTSLAMIAFAANSVLGRLGLLGGDIGAGSFALIRLISGAVVLGFLVNPSTALRSGHWRGGLALFIYAAFFSYAYLQLAAGTGALILFATVQIIMVGAGLINGERFTGLQWAGLLAAFAALVWLLSPGLEAPPLIGAGAMIIAGAGWGLYSLLGRSASGDPIVDTAGHFLRAGLIALVFLLPIILWLAPEQRPGPSGASLAIISGAVTSGLGYAIWYRALKGLTATRAGIAQLTVPALAALGGILFLQEQLTLRFIIASLVILTGVGFATLTPNRR